jgi:hypothetical protein
MSSVIKKVLSDIKSYIKIKFLDIVLVGIWDIFVLDTL